MTKIEALELELAARKMVDGTGLYWGEVLRYASDKKPVFVHIWNDLNNDREIRPRNTYELALDIIEGKPVWKGDKLWNIPTSKEYTVTCKLNNPADWSWLPPKPKTAMVELPVEDIEYYVNERFISIAEMLDMIDRRTEACRKALEELK